jgi:hypothetical protein
MDNGNHDYGFSKSYFLYYFYVVRFQALRVSEIFLLLHRQEPSVIHLYVPNTSVLFRRSAS